MVQFVYTKRSISPFFTMVMALVMSSFGITNQAQGQNSLACTNQIQLSLGASCSDTIYPDLFLKTDTAGISGSLWIEIKDSNGTPIDSGTYADPAIVNAVGTYSVSIHYDDPADGFSNESDNSCWGTLLVELKNLDLEMDVVCGENDGSCMYSCIYIDSIFMNSVFTDSLNLNPNFSGIDTLYPCIDIDTNAITFKDELVGNDICHELTIKRTWYVPSPIVNSYNGNDGEQTLATQYFRIKADTLSRVMAPRYYIEIACGTDKDPQSIFDHLISKTNPLDPDSALVSAFPFIYGVKTGTGSLAMPSPLSMDSIRVPLKPGVLNSSKTHISCNLAVSYYDHSDIPICGKGVKFIRTWSIIDWCTQNDTSFTQIIDATGQGEIQLDMKTDTFNLSTDPWFCSADLLMDVPFVDAICSDDYWITLRNVTLGIDQTFSSGASIMTAANLPPGTHELAIEVEDGCNNKVTDTIYVNVSDKISPVAVAKEHVVATLLSGGDDRCAAKVRANSIDNNSYDACSNDNVKIEVKRFNDHDSTYGPFVELTAADLTDTDSRGIDFGIVKVALRVWDDGDGNGTPGTEGDNFNIAWTNVRIEDKNTDVFAECGKSVVEVNCDENMVNLIQEYKPIARRAGCTEEDIDVEGRIVADGRDDLCGQGGVTVEYRARGKVLCVKKFWFTVIDSVSIDSTVFPLDVLDAKCTDQDFGDFDFSNVELDCRLIGTSIEEETFEFESGISCLKILRHFTVIDWCEHDANRETFYTYEHGISIGYSRVDTGSAGSTNMIGYDTIRNGIWKRTQVVKISDGIAPTLTGCVDSTFSADANCETMITLTNSAMDNVAGGICPSGNLHWQVLVDKDHDNVYETEATVTGSNTVTATLPGKWSVGTYNVRWRVQDVCGNGAACETKFHVVDDKAPTPICIQTLSTAVMTQGQNITIWASDFIASPPSDPCSPTVEYSFSELDPDEKNKTISCADITNGISQIFEFNIYAHDESGNVGFCIAQIKVDDTANACEDVVTGNALIAGSVFTPEGDDVESAKISISSLNEGAVYERETSVSGEYAFEGMPMYYTYRVNSEKNDDYLNGVSTLDLVLIQKHILGLDLLSSAYKVIAADINSDERISAIDLVELRKLVLGIYAELPQNNSWRFVDANESFDDIYNPWPFTEALDLTLDHNTSGMDFVGVKIGDVSGNAVANSLIAQGRSVNNEVVLNAIDSEVRAGQEFVLRISANNVLDVAGLQLGLEFNGAILTDVASDAIALTNDDMYAQESSLNLSWVDATGINLDGEILSLTFTATTDGLISEMVQFSNAYRSEVYTGTDLEVNDVQLAFSGASESVVGTVFELYQNEPNPFNATTDIKFLIGSDGPATLSVFDITGKMIFEVTDTYTKGHNTVSLDKGQLNASGVLYYQLNFEGNIATRKMISID